MPETSLAFWFLLHEQQNNNFIFTCTNKLEYENFPEKWGGGGVYVYELIGCTN